MLDIFLNVSPSARDAFAGQGYLVGLVFSRWVVFGGEQNPVGVFCVVLFILLMHSFEIVLLSLLFSCSLSSAPHFFFFIFSSWGIIVLPFPRFLNTIIYSNLRKVSPPFTTVPFPSFNPRSFFAVLRS